MTRRLASLASLPLLVTLGCGDSRSGSAPGSAPGGSARPGTASAVGAASASAIVSAAPTSSSLTVSSAASALTASASASQSAGAASPCSAGARKDDDARFCITLGANVLPISWDGDTAATGVVERLEVDRVDIVITRGPGAAGLTVAKLRESMREGSDVVERGELPSGYWFHTVNGAKEHRVESSILSGRYVISCIASLSEDEVDRGRAICKSLTAY